MNQIRCFVAAVLLIQTTSAIPGFDEGLAAYQRDDMPTAVKELAEAAQKKDPRALYLLADMYREGKGVGMDYSKAVALHRQAVDLGYLPSALELAQAYARGLGGLERNTAEALRLLTFAAEGGVTAAQLQLAGLLLEGKEVPKDAPAAIGWLRKAAAAGDPGAQYQLAVQLTAGLNVAKSVQEGVTWLQKSALAGNPAAMFDLGLAYREGFGLPKNEAEAMNWIRAAAQKNHPEALTQIGWRQYRGDGVKRDIQEGLSLLRRAAMLEDLRGQYYLSWILLNDENLLNAKEGMQWLRKSAERGHAEAQSDLAEQYFTGQHTAKDPRAAYSWIRKAADQGNVNGLFGVGICYYQGVGVPKNDTEAARWFRRAAEKGAVSAQAQLAYMLIDGEGVAKDVVEGSAWMHAAITGSRDSEQRAAWQKGRDDALASLPADDKARAAARGEQYAAKYSRARP